MVTWLSVWKSLVECISLSLSLFLMAQSLLQVLLFSFAHSHIYTIAWRNLNMLILLSPGVNMNTTNLFLYSYTCAINTFLWMCVWVRVQGQVHMTIKASVRCERMCPLGSSRYVSHQAFQSQTVTFEPKNSSTHILCKRAHTQIALPAPTRTTAACKATRGEP